MDLSFLPAVNASLNAVATVLLVRGRLLIRAGRVDAHRRTMLSAFAVSALFLALYALQILPVNYAGLALIALGIALMVTEAFVPAFGALGIGGIACFVLGSIMLIDTDIPEFELSPVLIGTVALINGGLFLIVLSFAARAWRKAPVSGIEAMTGLTGKVVEWRDGRGRVLARGEIWSAVGPKMIEPDSTVDIERVNGLTLQVRPRASEPARET